MTMKLTWNNPLWYRKYRIFVGEPQYGKQFTYCYTHDDYDGAPDANDDRCGFAPSIEQAVEAIDELEDEE